MRIFQSLFSAAGRKNLFLAALLLGSGGFLAFADSVACGVDGFPPGTGQPSGQTVPCSEAPFIITANFPKLSVSGNRLEVFPQVSIDSTISATTHQYAAAVNFDDRFALPNSPAGDILKLSASYGTHLIHGDPGSYASFMAQIGPGSGTSPEITLNPANQNCEFGNCRYFATLPADAFSFVDVQGMLGLLLLPSGTPVGHSGDTGGDFTFTRFKADGVTPDPFTTTPEPRSSALALAGILLFGLVRFFGKAAVDRYYKKRWWQRPLVAKRVCSQA